MTKDASTEEEQNILNSHKDTMNVATVVQKHYNEYLGQHFLRRENYNYSWPFLTKKISKY
jgi:hypothetical protein